MKELHDLLVGYSDPKVPFVGPIPLGETGLTVRIRYVALLEAAYRSLGRSQAFGFGRRHFPLTFPFQMETIRDAWQSEIMRVMDHPRSGKYENLTVQLFHEKFQSEPSIDQSKKDQEQGRYDPMIERYKRDGYAEFRNKAGFHIDKAEALKEPKLGGICTT